MKVSLPPSPWVPVVLILLSGIGVAAAQTSYPLKLNDPLALGGFAGSAQITPDGSRVVYLGDQETDGLTELYSKPLAGGPAVKLNETPVVGGDVLAFQISPDGSRVVYRADQEEDGVEELFSVPIAGGSSVKLNDPLVSGGEVQDSFQITADSSWVVYSADQDTDSKAELYSVPLAGGTVVKLNVPLGSDRDAWSDFKVSPDSTRVVYRANVDSFSVIELYSVPVGGGASVKLNGTMVPGGSLDFSNQFRISSDSSRVVYSGDQDVNNQYDLYSVPLAGGAVVKINVLPVVLSTPNFEISPDASRVVYLANNGPGLGFELYRVPIGGGAGVKLNGSLVSGGSVWSFLTSPDSSRVVYVADQQTNDDFEIYSVPLGGGAAVKLNPPLVSGGDVLPSIGNFAISADSNRAVYLADQETDGVTELYSVPLGGGPATKLNGSLVSGGNVSAPIVLSPDSSRVVYRADQETDFVTEIYSVPLAGGTPVKLNGPLPPGGVTSTAVISPDSSEVVYSAEQETDGIFDLYLVPTTGGVPVKLSAPSAIHGDVSDFEISPDGKRAVYLADGDTDRVVELYSVPTAGGAVVKLSGSLVVGGNVSDFQISADGHRVVYRADQDVDNVRELYSVPIGGGTVVKLNGLLPPGGSVPFSDGVYLISPDSSRVVYVADQDTDNVNELYSVPTEGGSPLKLNPPLVAGGAVASGFLISPDSSRVIYRADQDTDDKFELYSVPLLGGGAVKLNGNLGSGALSTGILVSSDSMRVVFRTFEATPQLVFELYSASISGGSRVKISGPLVPGGSVSSNPNGFRISADGSRVVYLADQDTDNVNELFSVPIGGGAPAKLNGTLQMNGQVEGGFQLSPDSRRVVYLADQDMDNVYELYSVPMGGGTVVKLNGALVVGGNVQFSSYRVTPDGSRVVYRAVQDTLGVVELYAVPIEGGPATKLNAPLVSGGTVFTDFAVTADGSQVTYLADQEADGVVELFRVPIGGGPGRKVNRSLVAGGAVQNFQLSPRGGEVGYRAEQDVDGVIELYLWKGQAVWETSGGDWFAVGNWRDETIPDALLEAVIATPAVVSIPAGVTPVEAASLYLGGPNGLSVLDLAGGAILSLPGGAEVVSGGVLRGDGVVSLGSEAFALPAGAELRAGAGERFLVESGAVSNAGRIEALGLSSFASEMEFSGAVTNLGGTGAILGNDSTFRFFQGLTNNGSLSFGAGLNNLFGDLNNASGGLALVSGGASALFWEDVTNNSVINVSASGGLQSAAVFFGTLSGNGVSGSGHVFIEGDMRPGFSAGTMAFGGDLTYGPFASMEIEIGGTMAGSGHDQVTVAGHLELNGTLNVTLLSPFVPSAGDSFDLWEAGSVAGAFHTINLPALPAGLFWHSSEVNTTGVLRVGCVPDSYPQFAAYYGLVGGPHDDDDDDRLTNILEYVLGQDPTQTSAPAGLPAVSWNGGNDEFVFTMASPIGPDVSLVIETSVDLVGWTVLATRSGNGPWTGAVSETPGVPCKVQVLLTNPTSLPRRFYRVGASLVP